MTKHSQAITKLATSMLIFGSIGIFVRHIPLESGMIALVRAVVGVLFLLAAVFVRRMKLSFANIKQNMLLLCISGAAIGFNWILLFESYRYTSVAVSTLCYYMAPIIVIILSPFVLKEPLSLKKGLCVAAAIVGMICISGIGSASAPGAEGYKGVILGLGAAVLYASVMLLNKKFTQIGAFDKTIMQLLVAGLVLIPYNFLTADMTALQFSLPTAGLLAFVGIVHTGLAYYLYFGSMDHLSGQSIAIASYIDPVVAVLASVLFLREPFTWLNLLGAVLILGSAVLSEMPDRKGR